MYRILLVDDDEDMAELCGFWLVKAGYDVKIVNGGKDAIDALIAESADVVLLDITMPDMSGEETLRRIRDNILIRDTPVFFRTGLEDGDIPENISELSPAGIIPKAEGKKMLLGVLEDFFHKKS